MEKEGCWQAWKRKKEGEGGGILLSMEDEEGRRRGKDAAGYGGGRRGRECNWQGYHLKEGEGEGCYW